jgi:hypothetical protein
MIQLPKSQEIRFDRSMIQWKYITRHHTIGIRNPYLAEPLSSLHGWLMIFTFHVPAWILHRCFTELMGCLYLLSCNTLTRHAWVSLSLLATVHVRDGGWLCWGFFLWRVSVADWLHWLCVVHCSFVHEMSFVAFGLFWLC